MNSKFISILVVVIVIAAGAFYFLKGTNYKVSPNNNSSSSQGITTTPQPTSTTGNLHAPVSKTVINASDQMLTPSTIVAVSKKQLTLTFQNNGKQSRSFVISGLSASTPILAPGQSATISVTPQKPGMYQITTGGASNSSASLKGLLMVQ